MTDQEVESHMGLRIDLRTILQFSVVVLAACRPGVTAGNPPGRTGAVELEQLQNPTPPSSYTFDPLLPFDAIPPVYDPEFLPADDIPYIDDELVIGVALGGQTKAYSITVLRAREMVNDELAGIPILVTW